MAIKSTITTIQGITLPQAYINLSSPQIQKVKTETGNTYKLGANACVYASKSAYDEGKIPVEGFSVVCEIDIAGNVIEQGYAQLKLSDRLSNITDLI